MTSSLFHCDNGGLLTIYICCSLRANFFLFVNSSLHASFKMYFHLLEREKRDVRCEYFENLFSFSHFQLFNNFEKKYSD